MTFPNSRRIAILGATGSIGTAAADVISHLQRIDSAGGWVLEGISGHRNLAGLAKLAERHQPRRIVISDEKKPNVGSHSQSSLALPLAFLPVAKWIAAASIWSNWPRTRGLTWWSLRSWDVRG